MNNFAKFCFVLAAVSLLVSCAAPPAATRNPPLVGTWYAGDDPARRCFIANTPSGLVITNEVGSSSRLLHPTIREIVAADWGGGLRGLAGKLENDKILWDNATWWAKAPKP